MTLSKLQHDSFHEMSPDGSILFEDWRIDVIHNSPTFAFCVSIPQLKLLVLIFVTSHREKNFDLCVGRLEALALWCFALDRTHYSCWLPVYIKDTKTLPPLITYQPKKNWVFLKAK